MKTPYTSQTVAIDSAPGRKLLRQIVKDPDEWTANASESTDWLLVLTRTVAGELGEPDAVVTVKTDLSLKPRGKVGQVDDCSGDGTSVFVPAITRIHLSHFDLPDVCQLLLDGWRIGSTTSVGSYNTSKLGLAYQQLFAYRRHYHSGPTISETTYQNGKQLTCGVCS